MRLFVYEHVTGGGMLAQSPPAALVREADLMLRTLVDELRVVPGVVVLASRDPRLPPLDGVEALRPSPGEAPLALYARGLADSEAAWPTAPETGGVLEQLARRTLAAGVRLIGCRPEAVAVAASKRRTAQVLAARGIAVVPTFTAGDPLPETPGALWVVKPDDGAGADGVQLVPGWRLAMARLIAEPGRLVAQPWLDGEAASLSVQCRDGRATLLAVNRQRVKVSPKGVSLAGLEVNALPDPGGRLAALADQVCRAIPGLDGYVGIDLLLGEDEPVVVEVNPRLTTSYVALGRALGINVARRLLDAADEAPAATAGPVSLVLEGADD